VASCDDDIVSGKESYEKQEDGRREQQLATFRSYRKTNYFLYTLHFSKMDYCYILVG